LENIKIRSRCDFDTELNIDAADIEPMITLVQILEWNWYFKSIPNASQVQGGVVMNRRRKRNKDTDNFLVTV
jgi:hypothetical protein